ncbi:MAG: N-acetyltransferase family protein [Sphingobium sp.]
MRIRPARAGDTAAIWSIIGPIIKAGETYALDRAMSEADAIAYWLAPEKDVFVAEDGADIVGSYYLKANHVGGGAHVANAGYATAAFATGRGVARAMCTHSLCHARSRGFHAMQFNFVVSSNSVAVRLWHSLGFETVGTLPQAFAHPSLGYVNAFVMFRVIT